MFRSQPPTIYLLLLLVVGVLVVSPLGGQTPQPIGPSVQVNTLTATINTGSQVAWRCDADVTMVVWWSDVSAGDDNSASSIQGRFFSGRTPTGPQFQVNDHTDGVQIVPQVRALDNGSFGVAWESGNTLRGKIYDRVTLAPGPELVIAPQAGSIEGFEMTTDGRFATVHRKGPAIRGKIFDATGTPQGAPLDVVLTETNFGNDTIVDILIGSESVIVYWMVEEVINTERHRRLAYQRFALDGSPLGPEVTVETTLHKPNQNAGTFIENVNVEILENGDILFGYLAIEEIDLGLNRIYRLFLERFDPEGQQNLSVALRESMDYIDIDELLVEPDGAFLVAWSSSPDLFAQRFEAGPHAGGPSFQLSDQIFSSAFSRIHLTRNAPGNPFAVVWDNLADTIYWRRFLSFPDILQDDFESGDTSRWCVARGEQ